MRTRRCLWTARLLDATSSRRRGLVDGAGADQRQLEGVGQGLAAGLDDVLGDADGAPAVAAVQGLDEDAGLGAGGGLGIEDAHLEVAQLDLAQERVVRVER